MALIIAFVLGYLLRALTSSETPVSSNNGGGVVFIAFILGFLLSCTLTMPYSMSKEEIIDRLHYVFGGLSSVIVIYLLPALAYAVTIFYFSISFYAIFIDKNSNSNDKGVGIAFLLIMFLCFIFFGMSAGSLYFFYYVCLLLLLLFVKNLMYEKVVRNY